MDNMFTCKCCNKDFNKMSTRFHYVNDDPICHDCFVENYFTCGHCYKMKSNVEMSMQELNASHTPYCKDCVSNSIRACEHCGGEINILVDPCRSGNNGQYFHIHCRDLYGYCDDCGHWGLKEDLWQSPVSHRQYCSVCQEEGRDEIYLRNCSDFCSERLDLSNNTFKHLRDKRCFGIELECNDENLPYDKVRAETKFGSVHDGSLDCGSEFVSPILQGDKGYNQVKAICDVLKHANVGGCTGYHVHLDARKIDYLVAKKIWALYTVFEDVLFSILPQSRQENSYCRSSILDVSSSYFQAINSYEELEEYWYEHHDCDEDWNDHYNSSRYSGCNLHSYFNQRTIEIRYHSGTTNFEKIMNWVKINQAIFRYAEAHTLQEILDLRNFGNCKTNYGIIRRLFKEVVKSETLWKYYKTRFNKFSSENIQYGRCMKKSMYFTGQIDSVAVNGDATYYSVGG